MANVYVIGFPNFSETETDTVDSGRKTSAQLISGYKCVAASSTVNGKTPYNLIGRSFSVAACGCINEILTNAFGAISAVALNSYFVSPFIVFTQ